MLTIYKYELSTNRETVIELPIGAEVLHVDGQNHSVQLWAVVDTEAKTLPRTFEVFGTGHPMPVAKRRFINTFLVQGGTYVFHAFERVQ